MSTTNLPSQPRPQLLHEAAGWIAFRELQLGMDADARELLAQSVEPRPGNKRYTIDQGKVFALCEMRDGGGLMEISQVFERLASGVCDPVPENMQDDLGSLLAETGYAWSQDEADPDIWRAVANDPRGYRCDLVTNSISGGLQVQGGLAAWETDLSETSQQAIAQFLVAAHDRVRFARFILQDRSVAAVSFAAGDRLESELHDSVLAVVAACRLVWREVRALTDNQVARAYLEIFA